jgi:hypothetical protein
MARFENTRALIRRFQLVVGLGFLACAGGLMLSLAIGNRLHDVIPTLRPIALAQVTAMAIRQLWEYAVLPLVCYGAARIIPLAPWSTAAGAMATGELFLLALDYFTGMSGMWFHAPLLLALHALSIGGGLWLSATAIRRAGEGAARAQTLALEAAVKKRHEYDEFTREAERIAALPRQASGPEGAPGAGAGSVAVVGVEAVAVDGAEPVAVDGAGSVAVDGAEPVAEPTPGTGTDPR